MPSSLPSDASPCILIADDDPAVLEVTQRMARALGWHPLVACSALDAIALFRERGPAIDCVLLDLHMPAMTGLEMLREIRGVRPGTRVVLMTGDLGVPSELGTGAGAPDHVLVKPFLVRELEHALAPRAEAA